MLPHFGYMSAQKSLQAALSYMELGWCVVPIGRKQDGSWKKPLVPWKSMQRRTATPASLKQWWKEWPDARVGIVTGSISDLVVVDIDPKNGGDASMVDLPSTLTVQTGGGGEHYYYSLPSKDTLVISGAGSPFPGIDIRAEGGIIVAPPSIHASGEPYVWADEFKPALIVPCPEWVVTKNRILSPTEHPERFHRTDTNRSTYPNGGLIERAKNIPIDLVIRHVAEQVGISVEFTSNPNGSRQIVENGHVTSGYISSQGNFCYSASGKPRRGNPIIIAEYYLNYIGKLNLSRKEIAQLILTIK